MRPALLLTLPLIFACGEKEPDPVQLCTDAKTAANSAWGAAHTAAVAFADGDEAKADKEAAAAASAEAKKAQSTSTAARHTPMGRGGSVVRGAARADASAKSGAASAAQAKAGRYGKLVDALQAAKDASLGEPKAAWDATIAARTALETFWAAPEAPPEPYAAALTAGESSWTTCSAVPAQ